MKRRWMIHAAVGALVVSTGVAAYAGKPAPTAFTICGMGMVGQNQMSGNSNESHPTPSNFTGNEQSAGTQCTADNSGPGSDSWTIEHSNVNVVTERGTEHGDLMRSGTADAAGFNGHITDYDLPNGDTCSSDGRTVYYQSGKARYCPTSFGPVGNINTHGGANTGQHFRGKYGTIIFQQNSNNHTCDVGSMMYCIQVDLAGQTN